MNEPNRTGSDFELGYTGSLQNVNEDDSLRKRRRDDTRIGKQYVPGGGLNDFFFPAAPKWTVGDALSRLLTKVKHNPNQMITVQKFIKDSCKGNLKKYLMTIRESMNRGDNVVMAEVAYHSFVQLAQGEKPLLNIYTPKSKPRTRAAAISPEGYAYKDYLVQVTEHGFSLMNARMVYSEVDSDSPPPKKKQKKNDVPRESSHNLPSFQLSPEMVQAQQQGFFVANLTGQETESATTLLMYTKGTFDLFLNSIYQLRNENEDLKQVNLAIKYANDQLEAELNSLRQQIHMTLPPESYNSLQSLDSNGMLTLQPSSSLDSHHSNVQRSESDSSSTTNPNVNQDPLGINIRFSNNIGMKNHNMSRSYSDVQSENIPRFLPSLSQ